jgi:hypothetical protein
VKSAEGNGVASGSTVTLTERSGVAVTVDGAVRAWLGLNSGDTTTVGADVAADGDVAFTIGVAEAKNGLKVGVGVELPAGGRVGVTGIAGPLHAVRTITSIPNDNN